MEDLFASHDALAVAQLVKTGKLGKHELLDATLARLRAVNASLNAITDFYDGELLAKSAAAAGEGPFEGVPFVVKQLMADCAGTPTTVGSRFFAHQPIAAADSAAVARMRRAGLVIVGRSNTSEFGLAPTTEPAFGGATVSPWGPTLSPGGSSGGSAAVVAARALPMAHATDGGGSIRIPAALCGLVGFKPTARRVPIDGVVPLSTSLDSIGPLAASVEDCAIVDALFAAEPVSIPASAPLAGLRFAVPMHYVMSDLDPVVATAFERSLKALAALGVRIDHIDLPELDELPRINSEGGFAAAEAYAWHQKLIERRGKDYDQLVYPRIMRGKEMSAASYIHLLAARADFQKRVWAATSHYDAVVMPTCAIAAPTLEEVSTPEGFTKKNLLLLRNTTVGNFLDRCAISLPCHAAGELPVGFMLMGEAMADKRLLAIARSVAPVVRAG